MFSRRQQADFRPLVQKAWLAECSRTGTAPNNRAAHESWYRRELLAGTGHYTSKDLDPVHGYDKAMLHFAIVAGNEALIDRFSKAEENRHRYILRRFLRDLSWLEETTIPWEYVRSMHTHANLPEDPEHCDANQLRKLIAMLDTHIRRRCRDLGVKPSQLPSKRIRHHEHRAAVH